MQVKDIMTHTVEVVSPGTTLDEAAERMRALDIGVLLVQDGDEVAGVIADRDMTVRAIARGLDPKKAVVGEVMPSSVGRVSLESISLP
jgi:CBS domain-containing protein